MIHLGNGTLYKTNQYGRLFELVQHLIFRQHRHQFLQKSELERFRNHQHWLCILEPWNIHLNTGSIWWVLNWSYLLFDSIQSRCIFYLFTAHWCSWLHIVNDGLTLRQYLWLCALVQSLLGFFHRLDYAQPWNHIWVLHISVSHFFVGKIAVLQFQFHDQDSPILKNDNWISLLVL